MIKEKIRPVPLKKVTIKNDFWSPRQALITDVVIPYQERILDDAVEGVEKSHAFANFRIAAGLEKGEFYGMVFQDSDVAKWLEAVAYSLLIKPDPELEKRADSIIKIIAAAQQEDGYLNTYFTVQAPEKRWTNLAECHELYCAGHMMEAAVAYCEATGKAALLRVMERMADHIGNRFVTQQHEGIPGHQEIEIGLMKLYHFTGKEKYRDLALHFLNQRGKDPSFFQREEAMRGWKYSESFDASNTKYNQSYAPVREQKAAEGHSVRAVYMYTAMADLAAETGDAALWDACCSLWNNVVQKRMYITGGLGSTADGEAFTIDYDLPNDTAYAETCASVGLIFWAKKMLDAHPSGQYADVMERALYNGVLSGMQLDGKRFFYVNPLEVHPEISGELFGFRHVLPKRPEWYACACCPTNVARLLASLGQYLWSESDDTIYSHLLIGSAACLHLADVRVESRLPWEGYAAYTLEPHASCFSLAIRLPAYAKNAIICVNGIECPPEEIRDGYVCLNREWHAGDRVELRFDMPVRRVRCNTFVRENIGRVALMRGPLVYCFEGQDNGGCLQELHLERYGRMEAEPFHSELLGGIVPVRAEGKRMSHHDTLYDEKEPVCETVPLRAIPYYAWGNRGVNQMSVWIHEAAN